MLTRCYILQYMVSASLSCFFTGGRVTLLNGLNSDYFRQVSCTVPYAFTQEYFLLASYPGFLHTHKMTHGFAESLGTTRLVWGSN